jgi:hypothetical protein
MSNENWYQIAVLIGTVVLLVISIAWVDALVGITQKYNWFSDPLIGQIVYAVVITIIGVIILLVVKPFSTEPGKTPPGAERAIREVRDVHVLPVPGV